MSDVTYGYALVDRWGIPQEFSPIEEYLENKKIHGEEVVPAWFVEDECGAKINLVSEFPEFTE